MAKISTYAPATPAGADLLLGTDTGSSDATKNFTIQAVADFAATSGVAGYSALITSTATSSPSAGDYVFIGATTHVCTLPTAVGVTGKLIGAIVTVVPAGAATVSIVPTGAETINGAASQVLAIQYTKFNFISDGTNWFIAAPNTFPLHITQGGTGAATAADAIVAMNGFNYTATSAATSAPTYGDFLSIDVATHTMTLPTAVGYAGRTIMMQLTVTAVSVTVDTTGVETINGAATLTINKDDTQYLFLSNGANWRYLGT